VRNLANKSADAAKDTEYLIEETQKSVVSGNTILTKTASSLNDVITSSYSISDTINEVSEYSLKQSKLLTNIDKYRQNFFCNPAKLISSRRRCSNKRRIIKSSSRTAYVS